jgi:acyl carrier protein
MRATKTFHDRRQFELSISFPDRRKGERRKNVIYTVEERRKFLKQGKLAILESLGLDPDKTDLRVCVKIILAEISGINPKHIDEDNEIRSLGLDSFKMVEMMAAIETVFDMTLLDDGAILHVRTVGDLINLITDHQGSLR